MIQINNTPRNAGVAISGDLMDLEELYDMLYLIVGEEGENPLMSSARMRVLGFCYDLRHAIMGEREFEFVDNGLEADMMRRLSMISSGKTVYMSFRVYWPEIRDSILAAANEHRCSPEELSIDVEYPDVEELGW